MSVSWLIRMEKINIKSLHTKAKIVGTLVTVAGALLMILYKGPVVEFVWTKSQSHHAASAATQDEGHWLMGTFMLLFSCFCWACFFILQVILFTSWSIELTVIYRTLLINTLCVCHLVFTRLIRWDHTRQSSPWPPWYASWELCRAAQLPLSWNAVHSLGSSDGTHDSSLLYIRYKYDWCIHIRVINLHTFTISQVCTGFCLSEWML